MARSRIIFYWLYRDAQTYNVGWKLVSVRVDASNHFTDGCCGGKGEYVLIRPDGYVGWIGLQENFVDLNDYLDRVIGQ